MTYEEATEYLFNKTANYETQGPIGYKEGLETTKALDEHFGHPHEHYRCVHIAGTNGKGSVSHSIAAILQMFGYRVGLYTSPHLCDFNERIRVNGKPIPHEYVTSFVTREKDYFEELGPSFFEITTMMAFKYFADKDVDIAVVEVGLGGRLDSTNIITPVLSVITNISLDHTQLLGSSLEQIAMEKGGIIKTGVLTVIGESTPETRPVFEMLAKEVNAPIVFADDPDEKEVATATPTNDGIYYTFKHLLPFTCELRGDYQVKNMNTVVVAMHKMVDMGYACDVTYTDSLPRIQKEMNEALSNVCKMTGLMGRWQIIRQHPTVVCDTGHNIGAWQWLSKQLTEVKCRRMRIVFGMVEDKDIYGVMSLLPKHATYYYTKGSTKRAFSENSLKVLGDQFGLNGEAYPTVEQAYNAAITGTTNEDFIFIGGSTYVVADFLKTRV